MFSNVRVEIQSIHKNTSLGCERLCRWGVGGDCWRRNAPQNLNPEGVSEKRIARKGGYDEISTRMIQPRPLAVPDVNAASWFVYQPTDELVLQSAETQHDLLPVWP